MAAELKESTHVVRTDAGLCGLWQPERFEYVVSLETWEEDVSEDDALERHIEAGAFVPLNVGGDGAFQVTVRSGGLTDREARYRLVSSQPYLLISRGLLALSGLEKVGHDVRDVTLLDAPAGRYAATVHLIDWKAEPGSVTAAGHPAADALPDFLVDIRSEPDPPPVYRSSVETFERP